VIADIRDGARLRLRQRRRGEFLFTEPADLKSPGHLKVIEQLRRPPIKLAILFSRPVQSAITTSASPISCLIFSSSGIVRILASPRLHETPNVVSI
jgi:hypothetical protein